MSSPLVAQTKAHLSKRRRKPPMAFDQRILWLGFLTGLPGALVALGLLWLGDYTPKVQWTLTFLIGTSWTWLTFALQERVIRPLQTISNLLAALREGDYSIRGRSDRRDDALGEVMLEINELSKTLQDQRLGTIEATAMLRTISAEIDVAIFAFDSDQILRLVNRAGERLLAQPLERLLGRNASDLGLVDCLEGEPAQTVQMAFPGGIGRYGVHRSTFREHGLPHHLLVFTDLSRQLREEERQAWQRLIRVIGHELNNSLTPIKSIAGSLETLLNRQPRPPDWEDDMQSGLSVIASRAESLSRFMAAYARLARLPQPRLAPLNVPSWIQRVVALETRLSVVIVPGPMITIQADQDQLEQLLINILRNGVDASMETSGKVAVGWTRHAAYLEIWVEDNGPGLSNVNNLFVPFFTTKPGGTGIGLVLSRQIAEAHGGSLILENRVPGPGCLARLHLPL